MTTDTGTTISPVETLAAVEKRLKSIVTDEPASRPDGKNVEIVIDIDVKHLTATFHCQSKEHVGSHKTRHVTFVADADCTLHFANPVVFGIDHTILEKRIAKVLSVRDEIRNEETDCWVSITVPSTGAGIPIEPSQRSVIDPRLVVP